MKREKDKYSFRIKLAIIITALIIAPTAIALSLFLKNDLVERVEKEVINAATEIVH